MGTRVFELRIAGRRRSRGWAASGKEDVVAETGVEEKSRDDGAGDSRRAVGGEKKGKVNTYTQTK